MVQAPRVSQRKKLAIFLVHQGGLSNRCSAQSNLFESFLGEGLVVNLNCYHAAKPLPKPLLTGIKFRDHLGKHVHASAKRFRVRAIVLDALLERAFV